MSRQSGYLKQISAIENSPLMKHLEAMNPIINNTSLDHIKALDSVINNTSLDYIKALDSAINNTSLDHIKALDSVINNTSLDYIKALDSTINNTSLDHIKALDSVINNTSLDYIKAFDSVINNTSLNHFKVLDSVINSVSLNSFEALDLITNPVWIRQSEFLNSLYTEQELSEFSGILSEVGSDLQQGNASERDVEKNLRKLPSIFFLILKYLFNYIVMPLFVGVCLQPLVAEFLKSNDEPRRVQKSLIKKLPQSSGIETTAVNRFISGDGVRLRASASIKSAVISHLDFGQLIYILEKDRSWVKVTVPQKDGSKLEGWVFNEYTERFRN
ncbi:SH3 domain-containing protein [Vibrio metschnikovii]|uniref:SH3 domain-containing protein n=1 Tax=Vibrio metschnikovii TaxID=28172 RepID=UPI001C2FFE3F|nr:SH3 domain-containing protein [Vibrio metschnikovii]